MDSLYLMQPENYCLLHRTLRLDGSTLISVYTRTLGLKIVEMYD